MRLLVGLDVACCRRDCHRRRRHSGAGGGSGNGGSSSRQRLESSHRRQRRQQHEKWPLGQGSRQDCSRRTWGRSCEAQRSVDSGICHGGWGVPRLGGAACDQRFGLCVRRGGSSVGSERRVSRPRLQGAAVAAGSLRRGVRARHSRGRGRRCSGGVIRPAGFGGSAARWNPACLSPAGAAAVRRRRGQFGQGARGVASAVCRARRSGAFPLEGKVGGPVGAVPPPQRATAACRVCQQSGEGPGTGRNDGAPGGAALGRGRPARAPAGQRRRALGARGERIVGPGSVPGFGDPGRLAGANSIAGASGRGEARFASPARAWPRGGQGGGRARGAPPQRAWRQRASASQRREHRGACSSLSRGRHERRREQRREFRLSQRWQRQRQRERRQQRQPELRKRRQQRQQRQQRR